jgi:hypothetical protein
MQMKFMKSADILKSARDVIYNKYVLYFVFLVALFDLFHAATTQDYLYCTLFILIGFLVSFFNKNMTVILVITIASATIIRNIAVGRRMKLEGFKEEQGQREEDNEEDADKNRPMEEDDESNVLHDGKDSKPNSLISGNSFSSSSSVSNVKSPGPTKETLMRELKDQAMELHETQKEIIGGFEKIAPYMDQAENIIQSINGTAKNIQAMRTMQ